MTTAREFLQDHPNLAIVPPQKAWPTMYDLPSEDPQEPGLPDEFHDLQPHLLSATLRLTDVAKDQIFTGTDINLYYDPNNTTWYKRPDWFAVAGVPRLYGGNDLRLSYVIWDEGVAPFIAVELISPGTAMADLGQVKREQNGTPTKWQVYEQILKVPNYVVYNRYDDELWGFRLVDGQYQSQDVSDGRFWLAEMKIGLGLWHGEYEGMTRDWLRWYDSEGEWIPTELELERSKADRLAAKLRELGVDPDSI